MMTTVFVHGNPESTAIWRPLIDQLADRGHANGIVLISPPGFGAPTPAGWGATPAEYADWLVGELAVLVERAGPVDLVGHDWGAGHVFGAVAQRPDLIRSWAADTAGLLNPNYQWHDLAQLWQTPDVGEQVVEAMLGMGSDGRAAAYTDSGMDPTVAAEVATAFDAEMARCILALYRGALPPATSELADQLQTALDRAEPRPRGLVIDPTADAYIGSDLADAVVDRFRTERVVLDGAGHYWMTDPAYLGRAADALIEFWAD